MQCWICGASVQGIWRMCAFGGRVCSRACLEEALIRRMERTMEGRVIPMRDCAECGRRFAQRRKDIVTCSRPCAKVHSQRRAYHKRRAESMETARRCPQCDTLFHGATEDRRFCSMMCAQAWHGLFQNVPVGKTFTLHGYDGVWTKVSPTTAQQDQGAIVTLPPTETVKLKRYPRW